ncbi:NAD-dependent epimerase/dehydratase [Rhodotorula toruloides]|uniref:NAD-dependent epimerase/dehydratase n=1 Tax=Rhodotorula toruloides TaxID=5286 RepID=A0A511KC79_RHOTO|nr:NAD-dependent epimerase/dehydratase [Rhodotorula toruloides]
MLKPLVLVTGASGYIGASVTHAFLRTGYRVRGTVRKQAQADAWREHFPHYKEKLGFAIVEDMGKEGAYDEAIKDVEVVVHTASPFFFGYTDNERDMLLPAVNGTLNILEAAHHAGTVRQVVLTSSFAALQDYHHGPDPAKVYTEEDWCPLTWEEAVNEEKDQVLVYVTSKKYAEKKAWDFLEEKRPNFSLTTILPVYVLGASEQPLDSIDGLSTSASWIREFIDKRDLPKAPIHAMIDVQDVALAHLRAVENARVTGGKRYLVAAHPFSGSVVAQILHQGFPDKQKRFPGARGEPSWDKEEPWKWDTSRYAVAGPAQCRAY